MSGDLGDQGDGRSVELVHGRLRAEILRGDLAPGQEISQVQLAKQLGVSRTPLREALRMLVDEGLVEIAANRVARAAGYSIADLEELYTMRVVLEAAAIRLTIPRLTPEGIAELEGLMAQMAHHAKARDYERWQVPHRAFHAALVAGSGARMTGWLSRLYDHAERYRWLYTVSQEPRGWGVGVAEHRAILDACENRDADTGAVALASHLGRTAFGVIARIEPRYEAFSLRTTLASLGVDPDTVETSSR